MLDRIVAEVEKEVEKRRSKGEDLSSRLTKVKSLSDAIAKSRRTPIIAEIKQKSPSEGTLRKGLNVVDMARDYEGGGAVAISVVTERNFFGGRLESLIEIRQEVRLPLIRKDFIIDEFQIQESFAYEADAVLFIVSLVRDRLGEFISFARELRLECITECHSKDEIEAAIHSGAEIIGINNRDLRTLNVDINKTKELAPFVPEDKFLISESGIKSAEDIRSLRDCRVDAFLIGTTLMRSPNPKETLARLANA